MAGCHLTPASAQSSTGDLIRPDAPAIPQGQTGAANLPPIETPPLEGPQAVDESALRYYGSMRQTDRVNAEIRRLQRLYPDWKVPDDIYRAADPSAGDEEELWALFGRDLMPELDQAIKARMASQPGWRPSNDLSNKIARKEFRLKILALANKGSYSDIVSAVQGQKLTPQNVDVDVLWAIADAYAKTKRMPEALAIYRSILSNDDKPSERFATAQKALANLPLSDAETVLAMARRDGSGQSEFAPLRLDVTRARIVAYLNDQPSQNIPPADWDAFVAAARAAPDGKEAALGAWYAFKRDMTQPALELFKLAMERGGDAMVAHGLALTLLRLGMRREAEEVAYAWREPLVNNAILFIDILAEDLTRDSPPMIEPQRLSRYGQVTAAYASGEGSQALAWYAFNSCQYDVALQWFERAMAWHPKGPTAMGYALTLQRLKQQQTFVDVVNRYDGLFPDVVGLMFPDNTQPQPNRCNTNPGTASNNQDRYLTGTRDQTRFASGASTNAGSQPRQGYGRVAPPSTFGSGTSAPEPLKLNRKEFPISVSPENDLRFAPAGQSLPPAVPGLLKEPFTGPWPLVARRVPGVGPMPYERYGYALLPGWNGITTPSTPPASAQIAPAGTLWAAEMRINAPSTDASGFRGGR